MQAIFAGRLSRPQYLASAGLAAMLLAAGSVVALLPRNHPATDPERMGIDAHCSIVAGQQLNARAVKVSCGLDKAGVQSVVARTVAGFDFADLIAKARAGRAQDEAGARQLAQQLGVNVDDLIAALRQIDQQPADGRTPADRFAAVIVGDPRIDIDAAPLRLAASSPPVQRNDAVQRLVHEAQRLRADCAAIAGGRVKADTIDVSCGPTAAEIQQLIKDAVNQADLARLIQVAAQGNDASSPQITAIASKLGLTDDSIRQILTRLGQEKVTGDAATQRFAELVRRHVDSVLRASTLPDDNIAVAALRDQAMTALAQGDAGRAEALLAAAGLVLRSAATDVPAQGSSPLTIAAQNDDRGRDLMRSHDYAGAIKLFAEAASRVPDELPLVRAGYLIDQANAAKALDAATSDGATHRNAADVYHRAYEFMILSVADLCPGQPDGGKTEDYKARSRDGHMTWELSCP
jgi:hypothetical protein